VRQLTAKNSPRTREEHPGGTFLFRKRAAGALDAGVEHRLSVFGVERAIDSVAA
jgi:hypothetical protein